LFDEPTNGWTRGCDEMLDSSKISHKGRQFDPVSHPLDVEGNALGDGKGTIAAATDRGAEVQPRGWRSGLGSGDRRFRSVREHSARPDWSAAETKGSQRPPGGRRARALRAGILEHAGPPPVRSALTLEDVFALRRKNDAFDAFGFTFDACSAFAKAANPWKANRRTTPRSDDEPNARRTNGRDERQR
jgi:hypothetical protein